MASKSELNEIDIKNQMCYYFGNKMAVSDVGFNDILLNKSHIKTL